MNTTMKVYPPYAPMEVVKGFRDLDNLILQEPPPAYDSRYLDPLSDFNFKLIFGKKAHKDLLKDFLNSVFEGRLHRKVIRDLHFSPTEHGGKKKETRKVLLDLLCTGDQGDQFLIEMQRDRQDFFSSRTHYYGCRIVSEQVPAGKEGDNFNHPNVYVIAIMDFNLWDDPSLPAHQLEEYISIYDTRRVGTWEPHPEQLELTYIELRKFTKTRDELQCRLDQWLHLLRNLSRLQEPLFPGDPICQKVFHVTELNNLDKEDRQMLIDHERDFRNKAKVWKREGLAQGIEQGIAQGIAQGIEQGLEKGLKRGRMEGIELGEKRGIEQEKLTFVQTLIKDTEFDDWKIAYLAGVEEIFVKTIRSRARVC